METTFAEKVRASREAALANHRFVTFHKEDLSKVSQFVESKAKISYTWYQTDLRVGIDIPYTLIKKDLLKTHFTEDKVTVEFPTESGTFHIELEVYSPIVTGGSKSVVHLNRIEIQMEKNVKHQLWPRLQKSETNAAQEAHIPQYPSSSIKKKDWGKL